MVDSWIATTIKTWDSFNGNGFFWYFDIKLSSETLSDNEKNGVTYYFSLFASEVYIGFGGFWLNLPEKKKKRENIINKSYHK